MSPIDTKHDCKTSAIAHWPLVLRNARRLTLKIGSSLLIEDKTFCVNYDWMRSLASDVAALQAHGKVTMIVSSGAVGLGRHYLGLKKGKLNLAQKQAAAAAGQPILMRAWEEVFAKFDLKTAQILLTREDTEKRRRWLNARETIDTLLKLGVIPIANENDTVATEEIKYGDNDRLAARVAMLMRADTLVLLSDIDGLYSSDPRKDKTATHIGLIEHLTPQIEAMAGGANQGAGFGTGGMATKLAAAKIAGSAGCDTLIIDGRIHAPLSALGSKQGVKHTHILASTNANAAYKAWIAGTVEPAGKIIIDQGAKEALVNGRSLLAAGIISVLGSFEKGDSIIIESSAQELARGICSYGSEDIDRIKGRASKDIEAILGYSCGDEVIHRDDLVMVS